MIPHAGKTKIMKMRADALKIHPLAQREIVPSKLRRVVSNMNLDGLGVVHVVQCSVKGRFGYWVVDGQHRVRALLELGFGEWELDVMLHVDVTDEAGASKLFLMLNDRSPVTPFDKFVNEVRAGEADAIGVDTTARKHGIKISRSHGDGKMTCVMALKRLYRHDEGVSLDKTLSLLIASFGTTAAAFEGRLVEGVGVVVSHYNGTLDYPALTKKLSTYHGGATGVIGHARGLMEHRKSTLSRCVAEIVVDTYNKGRRSGKLDAL